uniref:Uncharacterized protein n=1 Tax=Ciona savignyi TaxID=51511 RepID=H2ZN23_CIOSA
MDGENSGDCKGGHSQSDNKDQTPTTMPCSHKQLSKSSISNRGDDENPDLPENSVSLKRPHELDADETDLKTKKKGLSRVYSCESVNEENMLPESVQDISIETACSAMNFSFKTNDASKPSPRLTYMQRKMQYRVKHLMKRSPQTAKKVHIRFGSDGTPQSIEKSKVLAKVKNFLSDDLQQMEEEKNNVDSVLSKEEEMVSNQQLKTTDFEKSRERASMTDTSSLIDGSTLSETLNSCSADAEESLN